MFILRHLLEALLNPLFIVFMLLLVGTLGFICQVRPRYIRYSLVTCVIFLPLFSTGWLPMYLTRSLESQYPAINNPNPHIHWVVVLGGGQAQYAENEAHQVLSSASIKRLLEGVRLYQKLPKAKLLLSGGEYPGYITEAERLAELSSWFAIPEKEVIIENRSMNTASQAKELKHWLNDEPFYLVTSAIHMPRAISLCRKEGLKPIAAPTDFTYFWQDERWEKYYLPNPKNMVYFSIAWHEILGRIWAKLQGQV